MKKLFTSIILLLSVTSFYAQNIEDLSFGTENTFDAVTWNIENFPKNGQTTIDYVKQIIKNLDVEVLAVQEISDTALFKQMVNELEGYDSYFNTSYSSGLDLAYIYKTSQLEFNDAYEILTGHQYYFYPRSPMVMEMTFLGNNFILINNHFKCCGDGVIDRDDTNDEEYRRYRSSEELKKYITDSDLTEENVILLGDLNDELTDESENNVFQMFIDDSLYKFADMSIAEGDNSNWSYPGWPSHLDHILITKGLFDEFDKDSSEVKTLKIGDYFSGGLSDYESNVSDHRPVGIKLLVDEQEEPTGIAGSKIPEFEFENYPNPFEEKTTFQFEKVTSDATIEIYNFQGRKIHSIKVASGKSSVRLNNEDLPTGIYFARFISQGRNIGATKLVKLR